MYYIILNVVNVTVLVFCINRVVSALRAAHRVATVQHAVSALNSHPAMTRVSAPADRGESYFLAEAQVLGNPHPFN